MARPKKLQPAYRHHKGTGQGVVTLDGKDFYCGQFNTRASVMKYNALIAEWLAGRDPAALDAKPEEKALPLLKPVIVELLDKYIRHCDEYYRHSEEGRNVEDVADTLRAFYGRLECDEFTPAMLDRLRREMIRGTHRPEAERSKPLARTTINQRVHRILRIFRWGVAQGIVAPLTLTALEALDGLKAGHTNAREPEKVRPVSDKAVDATVAHLPPMIRDMVEVQRHTGMRSGELVIMRGCDIDRSGPVWVYRPEHHKTAHHGHERVVFIGPKAQAVLAKYLRTGYVFSPRAADQARRRKLHAGRKTPMNQGNKPGSNRKANPRRKPGEHYTPDSYWLAVRRACDKAGVPRWKPHQLRHLAATRLRKEFGIELARVVCGHKSLDATEIYAEQDLQKAAAAIAKVG